MHILQKISYFIYPPKCFYCKTEQQTYGLCKQCYLKLSFSKNQCFYCNAPLLLDDNLSLCKRCIPKIKEFSNLYFVCFYQAVIKKLIYDYKFNSQTDLSALFANLICQYTPIRKYDFEKTVLIPVPIHRYRIFKRGYNQSVLLCTELAKLLTCKTYSNVLIKTRNTKHQVGLGKEARKSNINDSFKIENNHLIKNKNIILIDDVITTGATINECAKTLNTAQVKSINIVAIAKVEGILKI